MNYQELLHLHGLPAKVRDYCESDLPPEVEPAHFKAYDEHDTKAFHLNAEKPEHREAVTHLAAGLSDVFAEAGVEPPLSDALGNGDEPSMSSASQPSGSLETGIREQFTAEDNPEEGGGTLWDCPDADEFDPPEHVESAPEEKQSLTVANGDLESDTTDDDRKQISLTDGFD